ncbi:MAG: hypothetical protein K8H86_02015 [Ignavibacteriaceae bacterium]|nr:hypothetical protein [Ignavibacteriaceae bacterium]
MKNLNEKNNIILITLLLIFISIESNIAQNPCPTIPDLLDHGWGPAQGEHNNRDEFAVLRTTPFLIKVDKYPPIKSFPIIPIGGCSPNTFCYMSFDSEEGMNGSPINEILIHNNWHNVTTYSGEIGWSFEIFPPSGFDVGIPDFVLNFNGTLHSKSWGNIPGWSYNDFVRNVSPYSPNFSVSITGPSNLLTGSTGEYIADINGGSGEYYISWEIKQLPGGTTTVINHHDLSLLPHFSIYGNNYYWYDDEHKQVVNMGNNNVELKVTIMDVSNDDLITATKIINKSNFAEIQFINNINGARDYGQLVLDEDKINKINSGSFVPVFPNVNHTIRTDVLPAANRWRNYNYSLKHLDWTTTSSQYELNFSFNISPLTPKEYISFFDFTTSSVIKTKIEGFDNLGKIKIKDPWHYYEDPNSHNWYQSNEFIEYNAPLQLLNSSVGDYGGVFPNMDYTNPNKPHYSIEAPVSILVNNHIHPLYFQRWSDVSGLSIEHFNNSLSAVSFTIYPSQATAYLKGSLLTNNANTYDHNSQRKFIRSKVDGVYHSVYSSMGKIWYETKTGTGNWTLMNNGNPICSNEAKNPSIIDLDNDYVAICYQENSNGPDIKAVVYNYATNQIAHGPYSLISSYDSYSLDNPIAIEFYNGQLEHLSYLLFVYKAFSSSGGTGPEPGLVYGYYTYDHNSKELSLSCWDNIIGTDINFSNPTLASSELINWQGMPKFYLAYQEDNFTNGSSKIWYQVVNPIASLDISHAQSNQISLNSGYTKNYKPRIVTLPGTDAYARLTWVGERTTEYVDEKTEAITQVTEKRALFRGSSPTSPFWNFGSNVRGSVIQKTNNHQNYFIVWNQFDNLTKETNNTTLSTIKTINSDGQQVDVCNGQTSSDVYGMIFNNAQTPYSFDMTNNLQSYFSLSKVTGSGIICSGREGTITKDNTSYYYSVGDVMVNGENI